MNHRIKVFLRMLIVTSVIVPSLRIHAQNEPSFQTDFPPEEFKARWEKVFEKIGDNAVALVAGIEDVRGFVLPRQTNEFYYLCGIESPNSYLLLDGRTRRVTLFLPARAGRGQGRDVAASDSELVKKITGADVVRSTEEMRGNWLSQPGQRGRMPVIYTPFQPGEGYAESRGEILSALTAIATDFWNGRLSREGQFIQLLRSRYPRAEIKDLIPIIDDMRSVKSPREIALIRRASQLAALGVIEVMKSAQTGLYEYQLEAAARYQFIVNGSRLDGYRAIIGAGTANISNGHYFRNNAKLNDGDLVLMDYSPDCGNYTSDIGRMFPVNGKFSPLQKEVLGFILIYHKETLKRIRPGVTPAQIMAEVKEVMEDVLKKTTFSKPVYEAAARTLVATGGGAFSHAVGMAVHDDGNYMPGPLKSGHVFAVDPQLWVREENLYYRYEDTVVITETGVEVLTSLAPTSLADIEKLMKAEGVVQKAPPSK
ncbi:MAG: aminopeptidase P N-terminal domain-containing protein [bacterium]